MMGPRFIEPEGRNSLSLHLVPKTPVRSVSSRCVLSIRSRRASRAKLAPEAVINANANLLRKAFQLYLFGYVQEVKDAMERPLEGAL